MVCTFIAMKWVSNLLEHEVSVWSVQNWGVRKVCAGRHTCCLLINQELIIRDEIIVHRGHIQHVTCTSMITRFHKRWLSQYHSSTTQCHVSSDLVIWRLDYNLGTSWDVLSLIHSWVNYPLWLVGVVGKSHFEIVSWELLKCTDLTSTAMSVPRNTQHKQKRVTLSNKDDIGEV